MYRRAWSLFYQFHGSILPNNSSSFPVSPSILALFIAYLYDKHYALSTVNTYVSAIGYSHKLAGAEDPQRSLFYRCLKGTRRKVSGSIADSLSRYLFWSVSCLPPSEPRFHVTKHTFSGNVCYCIFCLFEGW